MKTSELTGAALDWAVAKCWGEVALVNGAPWLVTGGLRYVQQRPFNPSTNWAQSGPIIERECIGVWWDGVWHAKYDGCRPDQVQDADTPLIAAMRCYVTSKLGDEVDIPKEIT